MNRDLLKWSCSRCHRNIHDLPYKHLEEVKLAGILIGRLCPKCADTLIDWIRGEI